ncbi:hypothetical protein [uncultured Microbacterium sp.]|uniref:hypothetical protein n=1 Tax=uncultured Microbacterium sp. TaxID=191216 RepID=UPI0028D1B005|nr:hypothetical protein [uncultured Microbacterium sp.]
MEWLWERSDEEGDEPLLVTNMLQNGRSVRGLSEIAGQGEHVTPHGKKCFNAGPVLAHAPDARALDFALILEHGYSLAVLESARSCLAEWAAGADAINLTDGQASRSSFFGDVKKDLDRAVSFGGNNGWSGSDAAASHVMSQRLSDRGSRRLRELLRRARHTFHAF